MQVCFVVKGLCVASFVDRSTSKYRDFYKIMLYKMTDKTLQNVTSQRILLNFIIMTVAL